MTDEKVERKIAVILATDVVGYSTRMEKNEDQTLQTLRACREIIQGLISEHHGRIFNTAGDSVLAEFQSAVEAVLCASEFQRTIKERNSALSDEARQMEFRVGINMGDVVIEGDNLYGDGVNVAARLEALAQPGGICLSKNVHEIVYKKMDLTFSDLGEQQIKDTVVHAVDVAVDGASVRKPSSTGQTPKNSRSGAVTYIAAAAVFVALVAGVGVWWWQDQSESPVQQALRPAGSKSIAVLPFSNLSGQQDQDYFADGMTEDLITDLSKVASLSVIARNSVFAYKNRAVDIRQVGEELGVRYVLEGSVRKAGDQLRVNAQLIDAVDAAHLWAERYDRKLENIFDVQDSVIKEIVTALSLELTDSEEENVSTRDTDNVAAYDLFSQGHHKYFQFTAQANREARALYRQAIELDPGYARAYGSIAFTYVNDVSNFWTKDPAESIQRAWDLAQAAVNLRSNVPQVYFALSFVLLHKDRPEEAMAALDKALAIDPNYADAYIMQANIASETGQLTLGLAAAKRAMELNPGYSLEYLGIVAKLHYAAGEYDKARESLEQGLERNPTYPLMLTMMVATYSALGMIDDANWAAEELLAVQPDFSVDKWVKSRPTAGQKIGEKMRQGLLDAGLK